MMVHSIVLVDNLGGKVMWVWRERVNIDEHNSISPIHQYEE